MKQITRWILCGIVLLNTGCSSLYWNSVLNEDEVWDEEFKEEIRELSDQQKGSQDPTLEDPQFFMRNKPKIKTAQIMLDSGKLIGKVREYIASLYEEVTGPDTPDVPPRTRIVGVWYGVDRSYDEAIIFTFRENGRFSRKSHGDTRMGTYTVEPSDEPHNITFFPGRETDGYASAFQFIDENTLLFEEQDRSVVLFRKM